ncbi:uncharacterized protein CG7065 [Ceratitis capitata]|uniref:uncharacterized protein CG7065 n=1 Tax=Ceratitis capitata TaxID=7213 RepID=UPI000329B475|nr:uncharacterized protein CG7065 [Ceratitis capitata]
MNITAGEPVPPGFEDEINREAEIQKAIDLYKGNALVGLEYTLELHEDDRREPGYFCVLCDKRGDPRSIMQHWTSYNHRLKYLEKHFPTAVREFNPVKYKPNSHQILLSIVQKLSKAIEDHHGRLQLTVGNGDDFRRMKAKFVGEINNKYHFDERNGPNFLDMIDRSLWESTANADSKNMEQTLQITIKAPKRLINENTPSKSNRDDLDEISSDSDGQSPGGKKLKKREQSPAYRVLPRVRRSPPFEEERSEERKDAEKKLPTPRELSLQASHIAQEKYKWEKYRCMLEIQFKQMEKIQQDYNKNPEKHPLYPEEWKKFWNRRYKELQLEKKTDPNKYDYKPEWIAFWTERMKELFKAEIEKKKKEIKKKIGLPENAEEIIDQLKEKYKVNIGRNAVGITAGGHVLGPKISDRNIDKRAKNIGDVINISDDESPIRRRNRHTRSRSRSPHSRSRSRRSRSKSPRISRGREYKRSRDRSTSLSKSPVSDDYNPFPPQAHVLRHRHHGHSYVPSSESDYFTSTYSSRGRFTSSSAHYSGAKHYRVLEPHQYPKYERSPSPTSKPAPAAKEDPQPEDDGPLTVVAVLRLLTALEDHLGSLGPKVIDLLGKALALEKVKANSADDLLLNEDHVVFFETIKEKLKGILIADVLDEQQKIRAVKKAIKNIAAVIHQVSSKGNSSNNTNKEPAKGKDNSESGLLVRKAEGVSVKDLPFDRQIIATKLAAALVFQGREDVSTEDMDKLIFLFILLVKLSKEKQQLDGKALQLGFILSQLGIYTSIPNSNQAAALGALPALVDELLENENNTVRSYNHSQVNDDDASNETVDKDSKNDGGGNMLESLTDSDLQTLLQNFKHLSSEEQHHLIAHLKKLETADPVRVEKLRKFVNLTDLAGAATSSPVAGTSKSNIRERSRDSRFDDSPIASNSKLRGHISDDDNDQDDRFRNISVANPNKFSLDDEDEDDDYNVDDVFKAAFRKVSDNSRQSKTETKVTHEGGSSSRSQMKPVPVAAPIIPVSSSPNALTFNRAGLNISLSDTQNLIANLMGSLQQSNSNKKSSSTSTQSKDGQAHQQIPTRSNVTIPPKNQNNQIQLQQQPPAMPYYPQQSQQQQQTQAYPGSGGYNQMGSMNNQAYYNTMGYNNNGSVGYTGYQQWGMGDAQQFGMQSFMGQQQQGPQQQMGYNNMYGQGPH